jgi:hypothetical protein
MVQNVRAIYFPYCLEKKEDGTWLLLNRNYKPVGFNTSGFINYDDYPVSMKIKGLTKLTLAKLSYNGKVEGSKVYLYNDGCVPTSSKKAMTEYLQRLEIILKLKTDI